MKKIISGLALASLMFSFLAGTPARASDLEKISAPEQIKNFRVMKKVGDMLYGFRITSATTTSSTLNMMVGTSTTSTSSVSQGLGELEKIAGPAMISLYNNIKKIGTALWGTKKDGGETKKATSTTPTIMIDPSIASCVSSVINVKDQAVMAEVTAAAASLNAAISARSTCQQAAVSMATSSQQMALQDCVKIFQIARREVNQTASQAQQSAWSTYRSTLRACQQDPRISTATSSDQMDGLMIEDGGDNTMDTVINSGNSN
jgi:hypothetical protein